MDPAYDSSKGPSKFIFDFSGKTEYNLGMRSLAIVSGFLSVACFAATPVARVISTAPVEVAGIMAPARNFVPAGAGDEVTAREQAVVVQFRDGSDVVLQPNSKIVLQGEADHPSVRILQGGARYNLAPGSRLRILDSKGEAMDAMVGRALQQSAQYVRADNLASPALIYRNPGTPRSGVKLPASAILTGQFSVSGTPGATGSGPSIVTPSGMKINLTPIINANGVTTGYKVGSISVPVTTPQGNVVFVEVTTGTMIGTTVTGVTSSTQAGTSVAIGFVPAGTSTPLTPAELQTSLENGTSTAVTTAISKGTLPAGTIVPAPTGISTGEFSSAPA